MISLSPKQKERASQTQAHLAVFRLRQAPFQRRPQVVNFGLDLVERFELLMAPQPRPGLLGPIQKEIQMPVS